VETKNESNRFKGRIIAALRRLSFSWYPRNEVKAAAKRFPATFECKSCGILVYEGSSKENYDNICNQTTSRVIMGKTVMDHIYPVVPPMEGFTTWDSYINQLFCSKEGFQLLCSECSEKKTRLEQEERKRNKKK